MAVNHESCQPTKHRFPAVLTFPICPEQKLPLESVLKLFKTEDNTNGFECLTRRVPGQDKPAPASPRAPLISVDQLRRSFRAALNDSVKPTGARRIKRLQLINGEVGFALADQVRTGCPFTLFRRQHAVFSHETLVWGCYSRWGRFCIKTYTVFYSSERDVDRHVTY